MTNLTIIDRLTKTYILWQDTIPHLPKKSRFSLGAKIDTFFLSSIELIFISSTMPKDKKLPYLQKAISQFDLLKFFLKIAWEIKAIDNKKYLLLSEPLNEIGRMLGGWQNNLLQFLQKTSVQKNGRNENICKGGQVDNCH